MLQSSSDAATPVDISESTDFTNFWLSYAYYQKYRDSGVSMNQVEALRLYVAVIEYPADDYQRCYGLPIGAFRTGAGDVLMATKKGLFFSILHNHRVELLLISGQI